MKFCVGEIACLGAEGGGDPFKEDVEVFFLFGFKCFGDSDDRRMGDVVVGMDFGF